LGGAAKGTAIIGLADVVFQNSRELYGLLHKAYHALHP